MHPILRPAFLVLALLALAGCASAPRSGPVPDDARTVATVRHTAGPQPAADWIARASLPADALPRAAGDALLLEVEIRDGDLRRVESAPLELANFIVRIEHTGPDASVFAIENRSTAALGYTLYGSPDGENYRRIPTCAVLSGAPAYERWPQPVSWIAVSDIRIAAAGECR